VPIVIDATGELCDFLGRDKDFAQFLRDWTMLDALIFCAERRINPNKES